MARAASIAGLYFAVAVISTWPLAPHLTEALPRGREMVATVPLFNAWTIWWNCDRAQQLYAGYWQAPIFYPVEDAFAFSEPMPLTVVGWPLWAATGNLTAVYNVLLLTALTWNGYSGFQISRRMGARPWIALAGGVMIETLPFVFNELGVFQLVPIFGIVYVLICLDGFSKSPSLARAAGLGASFALTYHLCTYYALFLAVAAPLPALMLLGRSLLYRRTWILLAVSGAVGLVLILPIFLAQWRVTRQYDMRRPLPLLQELSARGADYGAAPWRPWLYPDVGSEAGRFHIRLSPGVFKYGLAAAGAVLGLWHASTRRWATALLMLAGVAFVLSLGLNVKIAGWAPYESLMRFIPGLSQARNVFRFGVFAQLAIALLAVLGLEAIMRVMGAKDASAAPWRRWSGPVAAAVLASVTIGELWPPRQFLYPMPGRQENSGWLTWLQNETPPDSVIACVPFPSGKAVGEYEATCAWMYLQSFHRRRMVNGYSGFFPPPALELKAIMAGFPNPESLLALSQRDVDYVVADRKRLPQTIRAEYGGALRLERVFADERAQIDVYRLVH